MKTSPDSGFSDYTTYTPAYTPLRVLNYFSYFATCSQNTCDITKQGGVYYLIYCPALRRRQITTAPDSLTEEWRDLRLTPPTCDASVRCVQITFLPFTLSVSFRKHNFCGALNRGREDHHGDGITHHWNDLTLVLLRCLFIYIKDPASGP